METDKEKTDKIIKKIAKEVTIDKETLWIKLNYFIIFIAI
jgi:D-mannonate dehydratase